MSKTSDTEGLSQTTSAPSQVQEVNAGSEKKVEANSSAETIKADKIGDAKSSEPKEYFVPKHRFDEVSNRLKELETQNATYKRFEENLEKNPAEVIAYLQQEFGLTKKEAKEAVKEAVKSEEVNPDFQNLKKDVDTLMSLQNEALLAEKAGTVFNQWQDKLKDVPAELRDQYEVLAENEFVKRLGSDVVAGLSKAKPEDIEEIYKAVDSQIKGIESAIKKAYLSRKVETVPNINSGAQNVVPRQVENLGTGVNKMNVVRNAAQYLKDQGLI